MYKRSTFCLSLYCNIGEAHIISILYYHYLIINMQEYLHIISTHFHKILYSLEQIFLYLFLYSHPNVFKAVRPTILSTVVFVGQFKCTPIIQLQRGSSFELCGSLYDMQCRTVHINISGDTFPADIHCAYSSLNIQTPQL